MKTKRQRNAWRPLRFGVTPEAHYAFDQIETLGRVLTIANSRPIEPQPFYALKAWLLGIYGCVDGSVVQEITRPCWDCNGDASIALPCDRCGSSGVYSSTRWELQRWRLGRDSFFVPVGRCFGDPSIFGKIKHRPRRGSNAAAIGLAAVFCPAFYLRWLDRIGQRDFNRVVRRAGRIADSLSVLQCRFEYAGEAPF